MINLIPEFLDDVRREIPQQIIKERAQLSSQGAVFLSLSKNGLNGSFEIQLKTFGLVPEREYQALLFEACQRCREKIKPLIELKTKDKELESVLKGVLKKFFKKNSWKIIKFSS